MSEPRYARLVAETLAEESIRLPEQTDARRAHVGAVIGDAIRARARIRRRRRTVVTCAAAAAGVLLVATAGALLHREGAPRAVAAPHAAPPTAVAMALHPEGDVRVERGGDPRAAREGDALDVGDRVVVGSGARAGIALATGTRLRLGAGSEMVVVDRGATQAFRVDTGSVQADVAKLHAGERFLVRTADAEIEVRGTSFLVENVPPDPRCEGGVRTRVTVYEGVVSVRAHDDEVRVPAGEAWPSCDPLARADATDADRAPPARAPAAPARRALPAATSATSAASDLGEQNAMFKDAMASKQRGDAAGALRGLDAFLQRFPGSALVENARVERMRLLSGRAAVDAAREYLRLYPQGYARADAEAILAVPE